MLTHIQLRNFAIVEQLTLDLHPGFTVLTGETGAGKSILLDALGLALGERAEVGVIRHGADRAEISVRFDLGTLPEAADWLREHELDADGECLIRRTVNRSGPSRAYINGQPSPVQTLRTLGDLLVDLHGQHEHQSLLRRDAQRQLLDDYASHDDLLHQVTETYHAWKTRAAELERLGGSAANREARLELLRYQVGELDALALAQDELAGLGQEHTRLAHARQLLETGQSTLQQLDDDNEATLSNQLGHCLSELQGLERIDGTLGSTTELLGGALIQLREATSELRHYLDRIDQDPERLSVVEQRLESIHDLARKHHIAPENLAALLPELQHELTELEDAGSYLSTLQKDIATLAARYQIQAKALGKNRHMTAKKLAGKITARMQELGMEGGRFAIDFEALPLERASALGLERVEFRVSANPGQPLQPLTKVASGGELSRISLAILVICAQRARIPTLIFDEVDVGVGGRVAEIVGLQLRALSHHRQVLCVTHLAQVATQGQHHLQVSKDKVQDTTSTRIVALSAEQRIDEVARMLGGIEITPQTLSHAREMIERARS